MSDTDAGSPPFDDHALAAWAATEAGELLERVREQGLTGKALKDAGDRSAHELLMRLLAEHRPADAVLSEEGKDDKARLHAERVWIVDPLDGTREFSEPPRDDWAVHVALWERGELVAGAVAQPGIGTTFHTGQAPAGADVDRSSTATGGLADATAELRQGARGGDRRRARADGIRGSKGDVGHP